MRYIYYTIGILVLVTAILAFSSTHFKVEVSKPAIVINDRVITQKELDGLLSESTSSNHTAGIIDSVITNELLIQEALAQGINKEESFRVSVEKFYEQSLIKILIDRRFKSLEPEISNQTIDRMIDHYTGLAGRDLVYSKISYDTLEDVEKGKTASIETIAANFDDLSDELKFTLVKVAQGEVSDPVKRGEQFVCFRLDSAAGPGSSDAENPVNIDEIRTFLTQQEKGAMFSRWIENLTTTAHIQILTDLPATEKED